MSLWVWLAGHSLGSLFWLWILRWGGARWVTGWKAFFLVHWLAASWNEEQIRLFALIMLIGEILWCVIGIVEPGLREF
ncbi:MAG: hypothetical protein OHK0012_03350 [Synechococcales cyanobacterium]